MDTIFGQIDWSEVGGFVMAVVFVVYIFERAWMLYQKVAHKGDSKDKDKDEPQRWINGWVRCVPPDVDIRKMARQIDELREIHEVFDDDGVRIWYVRRSFYDMMQQTTEALQKISVLLPTLVDNQRKMDHRLEEIQHNTERRE